jgi:lipoprotein-anchoring transpeptidase ErfK/SrfK
MFSACDPYQPRFSLGPRGAWRSCVLAGAAGLVFGLTAACGEMGRAPGRGESTTDGVAGTPLPANDGVAPDEAQGGTERGTDLALPGERSVAAAERRAPLELDLPTRRVERGPTDTLTTDAPPRAVDRVRVSVSQQRLQLFSGREVLREYPVSTAAKGAGSQAGSQKTPLGRHQVHSKFGAGEPLGTIFESRRSTGRVATIHTAPVDLPEDVITTRILWLEGLEPGMNRGEGVDSRARFIYIHGTNEEGLIGRPASHGCVRLRNRDVAELFDLVATGTVVEIVE